MTPRTLLDALSHSLSARIPTLTLGEPGVGKSAIHMQAAERVGMLAKVLYPAMLDPTDVGGMPVPHDGRLERLLDDTLAPLLTETRPTMLLLDELGQASPAMQAACAPLILENRLGSRHMPPSVVVCAATNRAHHMAGAGRLLTHLVSRMSVLELNSHHPDWHQWAVSHEVHPEITGYLQSTPAHLHVFDPARASERAEPYPCERSWVRLSRHIRAGLPSSCAHEIIAGCVGPAHATQYMAYREIASTVDIGAYLRDPALKMPTTPGAQWCLASGAAAAAGQDTLPQVLALGARMLRAKPRLGVFAALLARDLLLRWPLATQHPAWHSPDGDAVREMLIA